LELESSDDGKNTSISSGAMMLPPDPSMPADMRGVSYHRCGTWACGPCGSTVDISIARGGAARRQLLCFDVKRTLTLTQKEALSVVRNARRWCTQSRILVETNCARRLFGKMSLFVNRCGERGLSGCLGVPMTSRADADDGQLGDANWVDAATLWKQNRNWLVICRQKIIG
jgi:hypothetical protein